MGDPKKPKKSFKRPRSIWTLDQLSSELYIIGSYGLRNKKELWKAQSKVANFRNQARTLLALTTEDRQEKESKLLASLYRLGLVNESAKVNLPGYMVKRAEEPEILVHVAVQQTAGS
jgi:small subunit ribosomal protein S4